LRRKNIFYNRFNEQAKLSFKTTKIRPYMTHEDILQALGNVQEPDLGKDIVTLNMVKGYYH
jgi:metal-sulfur cluster biosynthetic enzyme